MKYYVYTPGYVAHVGGIVALHRLAGLIHECGRECCLVTTRSADSCQVPLIRISEFSKDECPKEFVVDAQGAMAIYPEGVLGNPLGCEKVTRWILRDTGNETYQKSDFIFRYHHRHNLSFNGGAYHGFLSVILYPTDQMDTYKRVFRWKVRILIRKERRRLMPLSWFIPIIDETEKSGFEAMLDEISKCWMFISYDTKSGYSTIAAYLGAMSIVVPNSQVDRRSFHSEYSSEYGVAYGWLDLWKTMFTRGKLRRRLKELPERNLEQVKKYLAIVESE